MSAHAQWPQCPPFPRVAVFYVTAAGFGRSRQDTVPNSLRCEITYLETLQ